MSAAEPRVDDDKVRRVVEAGRAQGIEVQPVTFPEETRTAADAARAVGCDVGQIVKSLVFTAGSDPVLLLVSGANRVDAGVAAAAAGVETLERADANLAKAATGFSIGATPPVGLANAPPCSWTRTSCNTTSFGRRPGGRTRSSPSNRARWRGRAGRRYAG